VPTETSTEVPATATAPSGIIVVTNTPEAVVNNVTTQAVTAVTGTQGGAEVPTTAPQQQAVAGVSSLPSTGSGTSGRNDGMLYFGLGLMVLGGVLAATRLPLRHR
jgi:hypothetical protein